MGKLNHGPNTKAKGKAGAFVYQQYEGMQVFKEYQPNVLNPNSPGQVATRTRFSLATKTNALLFPWLLPVIKANGIAYTRFQRGDVLKKLMSSIVYDSANGKAALTQFPALRPNGNTSAPIVMTSSITGQELSMAVKVADSMSESIAAAMAVFFPANGGVPFVQTDGGEVRLNEHDEYEWSHNFSIPTGFQGSIVVLAYCTEESEFATGVNYGDIVGTSSTTIASLSNEELTATAVNISNMTQKTFWMA